MSKTAAVTLPPGKESEKDLIFEAADGDNIDTVLTPIRFFVYPIETNKTRFFRRLARNFSDEWRKNNPTMYQSRKTGICHLPGSRTTLILTVGVIVFYLSVSTFIIASGRLPRPRLGQRRTHGGGQKGRDTCGFPSSLNSYLSLAS